MNELEKQIEERADQIEDLDLDCDSKAYLEGFWEGVNFILEKNLIEKFTIWKDQEVQYHAPTLQDPTYFYYLVKDNKVEFFTIQDMIDYWLNNVYGK